MEAKPKRRRKRNVGRPTVMTKEVLTKLKDAFLMDCTDEEACAYAGIAMATLYNYQNSEPSFLEKKKAWKQDPFLRARKTVVDSLRDVDTAKWYLERKKKDEFSTRNELTGADGDALNVVLDRQETDYDKLGQEAGEQVVASQQPVPSEGQAGQASEIPPQPDPTPTPQPEGEPPAQPNPQS